MIINHLARPLVPGGRGGRRADGEEEDEEEEIFYGAHLTSPTCSGRTMK